MDENLVMHENIKDDYSADLDNMSNNSLVENNVNNTLLPTSGLKQEDEANMPVIAKQLLLEANNYQNDTLAETQANINRFRQLLPQYEIYPNKIAEEMYFDMLEGIPSNKDDKYPLLNSSLSDLLLKVESENSGTDYNNLPGRNSMRSVNRTRNFGKRDSI